MNDLSEIRTVPELFCTVFRELKELNVQGKEKESRCNAFCEMKYPMLKFKSLSSCNFWSHIWCM